MPIIIHRERRFDAAAGGGLWQEGGGGETGLRGPGRNAAGGVRRVPSREKRNVPVFNHRSAGEGKGGKARSRQNAVAGTSPAAKVRPIAWRPGKQKR